MPPLNRYLGSGILLYKASRIEPFVPFSTDPKKQVAFHGVKVLAKVNIQKKHILEAIYETCWGDYLTTGDIGSN